MKMLPYIALSVISSLLLAACAPTPTPSQVYQGQSAQQIFSTAETSLAKKSYTEALQAFEALDALYPFGPQAQQAQLDIIYAYYQTDDMPSTVAAANRYIRLHPQSPRVDYAYYMKALANFYQDRGSLQRYLPVDPALRDPGTGRQAFADFADLLRLYPNSPYAADARQRMQYLRNLYAHYEMSVADYYMRRKAYVAAANRATYVLQHYQGTPSTRDALRVLVEANRALGLNKAAADAEQVLRMN